MSDRRIWSIPTLFRKGLSPSVSLILGVLILVGATGSPLEAQSEHLGILAEKFQSELEGVAAAVPGVMGISVVDLTTGERYEVNGELDFPQGSSIKIPILVKLYRQPSAGELSIDEQQQIPEPKMTRSSRTIRQSSKG